MIKLHLHLRGPETGPHGEQIAIVRTTVVPRKDERIRIRSEHAPDSIYRVLGETEHRISLWPLDDAPSVHISVERLSK